MQKHWVWLATRSGIGVRGRAELLRRFGTAERIYAMDRAALQAEEGLRRSWLEPLLDKTLDGAERILAQCDRFDIRLLTYAEPAYPERLRNIADPPALLYYQGRLPDFDHEAAIAVVGSRRCSAYGLLHAKQFSRLIAASGGLVMSGGARGIDTMALQSAMDLPEPVVCVLACGLDIAYPPENGQLFAQIASRGCLLSEYPPGTSPMRGNFPVRNRILSGLSVGVLVVEASAQSGALITARLALEQGRGRICHSRQSRRRLVRGDESPAARGGAHARKRLGAAAGIHAPVSRQAGGRSPPRGDGAALWVALRSGRPCAAPAGETGKTGPPGSAFTGKVPSPRQKRH